MSFRLLILLAWMAAAPALRPQVPEPPEPASPPAGLEETVIDGTNPELDPWSDQNVAGTETETETGTEPADHARIHRRLHGPVLFGDFLLKTNETVRDVVVIGGNADIRGTVEGTVVVIGGRLRLSGTVEQEVIVVLGGADVLDGSRIEREAVLIGGPFHISESADFDGERTMIPLGDIAPKIDWFKRWLFSGLMMGRLLPFTVEWPWIVAGFFTLGYLLMLMLFPSASRATVRALEDAPVTSILVGMLVLTLFPPLVFLLVISVVGIVVIPFLKLAIFLLAVFGKVGVLCMIGRSFGKSTGVAALERPFPAFVIGALLLTLAYTIPVVGLLAWATTSVFGLGAATVALASRFKKEENAPPARVHAATVNLPSAPGLNPLSPGPSAASLGAGDVLLLSRAGFWKRLGASLLDLILLGFLATVLKEWIILAAIVYFVTLWTWRGTTLGGIVLGLKIVRTDGSAITFPVALVRSLASIFSLVVLGLGFLWAGWDREKQSWHDKIAGTVVVQMPKDFALV